MLKSFPSFRQLLEAMTEKHRSVASRILKEFHDEFYAAPGGLNKHQNWHGGYAGHVHETMSIAYIFYQQMAKYRVIPFSLSSALFVLFFHDLEKMFRYDVDRSGRPKKTKFANNHTYRTALVIMRRLKIPVTAEERNALQYIHGENEDYHPTRRIMNQLAAFVHCCDTLSARVWYDYPRTHRS